MAWVVEALTGSGYWSPQYLSRSDWSTGFAARYPVYESEAAAQSAREELICVGWHPDRVRVAEVV